jgi:hypothetical protein
MTTIADRGVAEPSQLLKSSAGKHAAVRQWLFKLLARLGERLSNVRDGHLLAVVTLGRISMPRE